MVLSEMIRFLKYDHPTLYRVLRQFHLTRRVTTTQHWFHKTYYPHPHLLQHNLVISSSCFNFAHYILFNLTFIYISLILLNIWDEVFKNRPSKICGRQPLKNLKCITLSRSYHFKFFKGCLPQI